MSFTREELKAVSQDPSWGYGAAVRELLAERDRLRAALEREVMRPAMDRQFCTLCRREVTGAAAVALFQHAPSCVLAELAAVRPPIACAECKTPIRKLVEPFEADWKPCRDCDGSLCEKCCDAKKVVR